MRVVNCNVLTVFSACHDVLEACDGVHVQHPSSHWFVTSPRCFISAARLNVCLKLAIICRNYHVGSIGVFLSHRHLHIDLLKELHCRTDATCQASGRKSAQSAPQALSQVNNLTLQLSHQGLLQSWDWMDLLAAPPTMQSLHMTFRKSVP